MVAGHKLRLNCVPQSLGDNWFMLAGVAGPLVDDLTQIDPVFEQVENAAAPEGDAAAMWAAVVRHPSMPSRVTTSRTDPNSR